MPHLCPVASQTATVLLHTSTKRTAQRSAPAPCACVSCLHSFLCFLCAIFTQLENESTVAKLWQSFDLPQQRPSHCLAVCCAASPRLPLLMLLLCHKPRTQPHKLGLARPARVHQPPPDVCHNSALCSAPLLAVAPSNAAQPHTPLADLVKHRAHAVARLHRCLLLLSSRFFCACPCWLCSWSNPPLCTQHTFTTRIVQTEALWSPAECFFPLSTLKTFQLSQRLFFLVE